MRRDGCDRLGVANVVSGGWRGVFVGGTQADLEISQRLERLLGLSGGVAMLACRCQRQGNGRGRTGTGELNELFKFGSQFFFPWSYTCVARCWLGHV